MSGKYGDLIKQARNTDNQLASKPEIQETRIPTVPLLEDPDVNLSIKVKRSQRAHWGAEAKRRGLTITEVITQALNDRFGIPPQP